MSGLIWALLILVLALVLLVLEMFVPSGGLLSVLSAVGFVTSLILAFRDNSMLGFVFLVGIAVGLPLVLMAMVKYWPHTSIGRMMLNMPPPGSEEEPTYNPLDDLIGRVGVAKSKMLPSGAVVIDGRTYDAVSTGTAIEPGDEIEVYRVEGNRVTVRPVTDETAVSDGRAASDSGPDVLDRTYDDAIPDPFDEPLS